MKKSNGGFTLIELLMVLAVMVVIFASMTVISREILQRARVSSARAAVNMIAVSLNSMHADTGRYPSELEELKSSMPPFQHNIPRRFWRGPYLHPGLSLVDPWGNPYFYELVFHETEPETEPEPEPETVFGPGTFTRGAGPPFDETFTFSAREGRAVIVMTNEAPAVAAGWIEVNGVQVISPHEFPIYPLIEKEIYLETENTIRIRLASGPGWSIGLRVDSFAGGEQDSGGEQEPGERSFVRYILGSYGRGGEPGGESYDADIIYRKTR